MKNIKGNELQYQLSEDAARHQYHVSGQTVDDIVNEMLEVELTLEGYYAGVFDEIKHREKL